MALLDHNGESEFPFSKDLVFNALCSAIPTINGMKIETADMLSGRVVVKSGVSLHSWGENVPIQLSSISDNRTQIRITSSPKTGIMFGGAMDMGKNRKNIEQILLATSRILASTQPLVENIVQNNSTQATNFKTQQNYNFTTVQPQKTGWYEKTWLVIILCLLVFPVGLYALWKNSTISKGWKIAITIFIAIAVFAKLNSGKDTVKESSTVTNIENTESPVAEKKWTEIYTFKGNGMKKSPSFTLSGNEARLKYSYKGQSGVGIGMFAIYVVGEGDDIMKHGGVPEIMTQAENEESEASLQKSEGRYYLNVNAVGSWAIVVEELK